MNIHEAAKAESRFLDLANDLDNGADITNAHRGARVLRALVGEYQDDAESVISDALADLRHACDLLGLSFFDQDRRARTNYQAELCECDQR